MTSKRNINIGEEVLLRVRVSAKDVYYAGGLVNGAWLLGLFGDVATEICIKHDGDEGLIRAYDSVDLLAPVLAGDFIEATGKIIKIGGTSRTLELVAKKVISSANIANHPSAAEVLDEPVIIGRASIVCVVPKKHQRYG